MDREKQYELVEKACAGDGEAFEILYKEKLRIIMYNAYNVLNDYHEAQDAAQEVVIKMYKYIKTIKKPESFNTWLQAIITNVCKSMLTKKSTVNEQIKEDEYFEEIEEDSLEFLPEEYLENHEMKYLLIKEINKLPSIRKRALFLYYFEGMSYNEIAKAMDCSVGIIAANISRGKTSLKNNLGFSTENDKSVSNKLGAAPLLSSAFAEDIKITCHKKWISKCEKACDSILKPLLQTGKQKITSRTMTKMISAVVIGTTILTFGIIKINNNISQASIDDSLKSKPEYSRDNTEMNKGINKDNSSDEKTKLNIDPANKNAGNPNSNNSSHETSSSTAPHNFGWLEFSGGDCDCGHVNPKDVKIKGLNPNINNTLWMIIRDRDNKVIYKGKESISSEIKEMYHQKLEGDYTIVYKYIDKKGNDVNVNKGFTLDIGYIGNNQYE